jgi:pimeloyl-ACP methyl ester carboxylesterase
MVPELLTFDIPSSPQLFTSSHRLTCYQWGDAHAKDTVMCVHGLTRNGRDFDFLAEALAKDFRVLAPDMPGRGKSEWLANPAGYSYPAYVADMQYMLAALKLSRVHWIGTSMGGIIGMMMANAIPGLLSSLVLNDVGCVVSAAGLKRIMSYAGIKMQFPSRTEGEATLRKICQPFGIRDERHWQHLFEYSLESAPDGGVRLAYDPNIAAAIPMAEPVDIHLWGLWPTVIQIPTLLIRGVDSDILSPDTAWAMQAQHPRLTFYEVPEAGHAPALMADAQTHYVRQWLGPFKSGI